MLLSSVRDALVTRFASYNSSRWIEDKKHVDDHCAPYYRSLLARTPIMPHTSPAIAAMQKLAQLVQVPHQTPPQTTPENPHPLGGNPETLPPKSASWSHHTSILDGDAVLNGLYEAFEPGDLCCKPDTIKAEMPEVYEFNRLTTKSAADAFWRRVLPQPTDQQRHQAQAVCGSALTHKTAAVAPPQYQQPLPVPGQPSPQPAIPGQTPGAGVPQPGAAVSQPPSVPGSPSNPVAAGGGLPQAPQAPGLGTAGATPTGGASPVAPGHPTMTGVAQRPIGLDRPQDTRAAALPGVPGHAATNVIDQQGGLDPRGLTVDGNNAAGIKKLAAVNICPRCGSLLSVPGLCLNCGIKKLAAACGVSTDNTQPTRVSKARILQALGMPADFEAGVRQKRAAGNVVGTPQFATTKLLRAITAVNRNQKSAGLLDHVRAVMGRVKRAFGSPELWAGVGVGAGTGALTAALGDPDAEGRKPWLSNTLTGGLVGGLAGQLYDGSPELLTGAGLGAGAGALTAAFSDPDAKGRKPWLSNTITGGLYGGLAGKLWSAASRVSAVEKEHAAAYKPTPAVPKIPATPLPKGRVVDTANHEVSVAAKDPAGFPKPGVQASHTLGDNIERYYGGRAGLDKAIADAQAAQARREPNTLLDAFQKWKAEDVDRKIPTTYVSQQDLGAYRAGQTQAEWRADSFRNTPGNILVGIGDGKSNATMNSHLEHELTHALTASRISVGTPLSRVHPPKDPAVNRAWMDYATSAAELDPRIAGIKRVYTKLTGEQVNTPEAADRALRFAANPQLSAFNTKPKPPVRFRNTDYPKQKLEYDKKLREWSNTRSPELQLKDHIEGSTLKYINETPAVRDTVIRRMLELVNRGQGAPQPSPV